jgi:hypothetical protein
MTEAGVRKKTGKMIEAGETKETEDMKMDPGRVSA